MDSGRVASAEDVLLFLSDVMAGRVKDQFGLEASLSDRLTAARELMKRLNVAEQGNTTLVRLDALLLAFRSAVQNDQKRGETDGKHDSDSD